MPINTGRLKDISWFLLRVVPAYLFIQAGGLKLFGWFGGMPPGVPMNAMVWTAGILEVFGGLAILLGIFTRPVAFILSGEMAVAYFLGHVMPNGHVLVPSLNQGQPAVLLCFIFFFFAFHGAGPWSLDAKLRHKG
jgi:putative oxidoreductase